MTGDVLWQGDARNPLAVGAAAALGVLALAMTLADSYLLALVAVVGGGAALPYTVVRVRITNESLMIRLGPWNWPAESHRINDIEWVEAITTNRSQVRLGVGSRGSKRTLKGRAYLVRPGPTLRLQGRLGRRTTVTVDGAEGAAAVLEQLLTSDPSAEST
jgi:hypothetical protein